MKKRKKKIPTFNKAKAERDMEALWRKIIYIQDDRVCQWCGDSAGAVIQAHHIIFKSSGKIPKFSVDNGMCLCKPCHFKIHNLRGKYSVEVGRMIEKYLNHKDLNYDQLKYTYKTSRITWNQTNIEIKKKVLEDILETLL